MSDDWTKLLEAAKSARANAYCPYSGYHVGSAALDDHGNIFAAANVENRSYGATICAERHAIGSMIAAGARSLKRLLVVSPDGVAPCGMCLQVIAEFADGDLPIALATESGEIEHTTLGSLLPRVFETDEVPRRF